MKPYNGVPKLKQLSHLKENYKGKNENGGRKCFFTQSKAYKNFVGSPGQWYGGAAWLNRLNAS